MARTMKVHTKGFCKKARKVSFATELDAKMALASRQAGDKGERRFYRCGRHWHLTSWARNED